MASGQASALRRLKRKGDDSRLLVRGAGVFRVVLLFRFCFTFKEVTLLAKELLSDWPVERWADRRLLVGVSGGADSVALLLALNELAVPGQLVAAHLNHGWRGRESDQDAAFVVKLCDGLGLPCHVGLLQHRDNPLANQSDDIGCRGVAMIAKDVASEDVKELEETDGQGVIEGQEYGELKTEEKARRARYDFFKETAYKVGASYVVTAHTADDRVETLLHNMLRGSGLAGAASLVMFRSFEQDLVLARPLLRKRRGLIEAFLHDRGQSFRQDSSNQLTRYRRNFLRREVLPLVNQSYPNATSSLLNFSELAEQLLADLDQLADQWLQEIGYRSDSQEFRAQATALQRPPWSIIQIALRRVWLEHGWPQADMSRLHWQSLRELCGRSAGVVNLPGNLRAEMAAGLFRIFKG